MHAPAAGDGARADAVRMLGPEGIGTHGIDPDLKADLRRHKGLGFNGGSRLGNRARRVVVRRLISPVLKNRDSADYAARGVFVGVLLAMTPTVGLQMVLCVIVWGMIRAVGRRWDFNLLVALAWTWASNVFTVPPLYYLFLLTGRIAQGRFDDLVGYSTFVAKLNTALAVDVGWLEAFWVYTVTLFQEFGLPMAIGCVPWALLAAWLGYRWTLRFVRRRQAVRTARRDSRRKDTPG